MSLESAEVVVGSTGHIWRGVLGTAFPTNISTAVNETLWTELGYTTEDGVGFNFDRSVNEVMGWQSYDPLRIIVESIPKEITTEFLQFNQNTWSTAAGGGTWSGSSPNFTYEPPDPSVLDQFALIVEFTDGSNSYRFGFPQVQVTSAFDFSTSRSEAISLPVTFKVLAPVVSTDKPFTFWTNDANLGDPLQAGS